MKRKALLFFMFFIILSPVFFGSASAFGDEALESVADDSGYNGITSSYITEQERSGEKSVDIFTKLILIIKDTFSGNGKGVIKSYAAVFGVLVLCAVMNTFAGFGDELTAVCSYASVITLSAMIYTVLYNLFVYVTAALEALMVAVTAFLPVMASLYTFSGNASAAAANSSALAIFLAVVSAVCSKLLLPLLRVSFAFAMLSAMPDGVDLSPLTNLVKSLTTFIMGFAFTLLGFVLCLQTSIAANADSYLTKSIRFVSGSFVPVIGGMLGDAAKTVFASVSVVKGTFGACGTVIILSAVIPPAAIVLINKLMLLLCSAAAKALGCRREGAFLESLGGITGMLMSLTLGAGAVSLIAMAVFVNVGNSG